MTQEELLAEQRVCRTVEIEWVESVNPSTGGNEENKVETLKASISDEEIAEGISDITMVYLNDEDTPVKAQNEAMTPKKLKNMMKRMKEDRTHKEIQIDLSSNKGLMSEVQGLFEGGSQASIAKAIMAIEKASGMKLR